MPRIPHAAVAIAIVAMLSTGPATAQGKSKFNWDALGTEFCRVTQLGDMAQIRPLLSNSLALEIEMAARSGQLQPGRTLFQSYKNEVPLCQASTRNAAVVAIERGVPNGGSPSWREYIVVVPEPDGSTRIDDVLFATRRSDTLRARLRQIRN
jgi:hypothetical protein